MTKAIQSKLIIAVFILGLLCVIVSAFSDSAFSSILLSLLILLMLVLPYITVRVDEEIKYRLCLAILAAGVLCLIGSLFQEMLMMPLVCFLMGGLPLMLLSINEEKKIFKLCMIVFPVGVLCLIASLFRNHLLLPAFMGLLYLPLKFGDMSDKRLSGWRIAAFVMYVLCLIAILCWKAPFLGYLSVFCIVFIVTRLILPGRVIDQQTLLIKIALIAMVMAVAMPVANKIKKMGTEITCKANMIYGIQNAFNNYDNGTYPSPDKWCDLLIENCDVGLKAFLCPASDAVEGECSYALNKHIYDRKSNQLPPDMVFLFETDAGKESGDRAESIKSRDFYQVLKNNKTKRTEYPGDTKVYPKRWNQIGGPEIATTAYHGKCHVVLVNGTVLEVKNEDVPNLRWDIDKTEPNMPL